MTHTDMLIQQCSACLWVVGNVLFLDGTNIQDIFNTHWLIVECTNVNISLLLINSQWF